jgi:DNA-binding response OmpR family regulator
MGKITVLLIEEDDDVRPVLRHNLQADGYDVLVAVDEQSALAWITSASARFDLILINLVDKTTGRAARQEAGRAGRFNFAGSHSRKIHVRAGRSGR